MNIIPYSEGCKKFPAPDETHFLKKVINKVEKNGAKWLKVENIYLFLLYQTFWLWRVLSVIIYAKLMPKGV